jgi:hypothetical protein
MLFYKKPKVVSTTKELLIDVLQLLAIIATVTILLTFPNWASALN